GRISVAASLLAGYRSALRQAIVAAMGRRVGVLLGTRRLVEIDRLLERNARGRSIAVGDGVQAELAAGRLTLYRSISGSDQVALRPGAAAECCGARFVIRPSLAESPARTGWATDLLPGEYRARSWRAGDRIRPLNGAGSRAVAVFFREARVAPSRRAAWPVVVNADDATIVWVPGICRSDARLPEEGTEAWRVDCAFA
ncbi:MAG: tRNA lysidine(34) synthetase TilS, partial [Gemmatimonadales bacterium]